MLLFGLAARNASRNVTRTGLTALMVVLGTAFLTLALTWTRGIFGGMIALVAANSGHVRIVDADYAAREDLQPLYENIPDVAPVLAKVAAAPGVRAAYPRIVSGVTLTVGDEIGEVFGLAVGAPTAWYTDELHVDEKLVAGHFLVDPTDIVMGSILAQKTGATIGSELIVLGQTQDGAMSPTKGTVVGIVSAGNALTDQQIFLPLERMQYVADIEGGATEILVYGDDAEDTGPVLAAVQQAIRGDQGLIAQSWNQRDPWQGLLALTGIIQGVLTGIIVFVAALGVWNTMMMSVLERTNEIGVMRAMGLGRAGAVSMFVVEALAIAIIGGTIGITLGGIGGYFLEIHGISLGSSIVQNASIPVSSRVYGDLSPSVLATSFFLGLLMAVIGSAFPALRAASIPPVAAMSARR